METRLESDLARSLFYDLASRKDRKQFHNWLVGSFGTDIDSRLSSRLQQDILDGRLRRPPIRLVPRNIIYNHLGAYDNKSREIYVSHTLLSAAQSSWRGRMMLFAVLLEEFGHHVDNVLRHSTAANTRIAHDAKLDEGALFGRALLLFLEQRGDNGKLNFAWTELNGGLEQTFQLSHQDMLRAGQEYFTDAAIRADDKSGRFEFFGAGDPPSEGGCFTHKSIEFDALNELPEYASDTNHRWKNQVYFGNWSRDFNQFIDPAMSFHEEHQKFFPKSSTVVKIFDVKARKEFGEHYDSFDGPEGEPKVRDPMWGHYLPWEHNDNPHGMYRADEHISDRFRMPYTDFELEIDPRTKMKRYLKTSSAQMDNDWQILENKGKGPLEDGDGGSLDPSEYKDQLIGIFSDWDENFKEKNPDKDLPEPRNKNPYPDESYSDASVYLYKDGNLPEKWDNKVAGWEEGGSNVEHWPQWRSSIEYIESELKIAEAGSQSFPPTAKSAFHLGNGMHTLEDFFAHSNFTEIALIEWVGSNAEVDSQKANFKKIDPWVPSPHVKDIILKEKGQEYGPFPNTEVHPHDTLMEKISYRSVDLNVPLPHNSFIPLVTGKFGLLDSIGCLLDKLANAEEHFKPKTFEEWKKEREEPWKRTEQHEIILIFLEEEKELIARLVGEAFGSEAETQVNNMSPSLADIFNTYLSTMEKILEIKQWFTQLKKKMGLEELSKQLTPSFVENFNEEIDQILYKTEHFFTVLNNIWMAKLLRRLWEMVGELETALDETNNFQFSSTNPTHTQLAKDCYCNPVHQLSANLARISARETARAMVGKWKGVGETDPLEVVKQFMTHPDDYDPGNNELHEMIYNEVTSWADEFLEQDSEKVNKKFSDMGNRISLFAYHSSSMRQTFEKVRKTTGGLLKCSKCDKKLEFSSLYTHYNPVDEEGNQKDAGSYCVGKVTDATLEESFESLLGVAGDLGGELGNNGKEIFESFLEELVDNSQSNSHLSFVQKTYEEYLEGDWFGVAECLLVGCRGIGLKLAHGIIDWVRDEIEHIEDVRENFIEPTHVGFGIRVNVHNPKHQYMLKRADGKVPNDKSKDGFIFGTGLRFDFAVLDLKEMEGTTDTASEENGVTKPRYPVPAASFEIDLGRVDDGERGWLWGCNDPCHFRCRSADGYVKWSKRDGWTVDAMLHDASWGNGAAKLARWLNAEGKEFKQSYEKLLGSPWVRRIGSDLAQVVDGSGDVDAEIEEIVDGSFFFIVNAMLEKFANEMKNPENTAKYEQFEVFMTLLDGLGLAVFSEDKNHWMIVEDSIESLLNDTGQYLRDRLTDQSENWDLEPILNVFTSHIFEGASWCVRLPDGATKTLDSLDKLAEIEEYSDLHLAIRVFDENSPANSRLEDLLLKINPSGIINVEMTGFQFGGGVSLDMGLNLDLGIDDLFISTDVSEVGDIDMSFNVGLNFGGELPGPLNTGRLHASYDIYENDLDLQLQFPGLSMLSSICPGVEIIPEAFTLVPLPDGIPVNGEIGNISTFFSSAAPILLVQTIAQEALDRYVLSMFTEFKSEQPPLWVEPFSKLLCSFDLIKKIESESGVVERYVTASLIPFACDPRSYLLHHLAGTMGELYGELPTSLPSLKVGELLNRLSPLTDLLEDMDVVSISNDQGVETISMSLKPNGVALAKLNIKMVEDSSVKFELIPSDDGFSLNDSSKLSFTLGMTLAEDGSVSANGSSIEFELKPAQIFNPNSTPEMFSKIFGPDSTLRLVIGMENGNLCASVDLNELADSHSNITLQLLPTFSGWTDLLVLLEDEVYSLLGKVLEKLYEELSEEVKVIVRDVAKIAGIWKEDINSLDITKIANLVDDPLGHLKTQLENDDIYDILNKALTNAAQSLPDIITLKQNNFGIKYTVSKDNLDVTLSASVNPINGNTDVEITVNYGELLKEPFVVRPGLQFKYSMNDEEASASLVFTLDNNNLDGAAITIIPSFSVKGPDMAGLASKAADEALSYIVEIDQVEKWLSTPLVEGSLTDISTPKILLSALGILEQDSENVKFKSIDSIVGHYTEDGHDIVTEFLVAILKDVTLYTSESSELEIHLVNKKEDGTIRYGLQLLFHGEYTSPPIGPIEFVLGVQEDGNSSKAPDGVTIYLLKKETSSDVELDLGLSLGGLEFLVRRQDRTPLLDTAFTLDELGVSAWFDLASKSDGFELNFGGMFVLGGFGIALGSGDGKEGENNNDLAAGLLGSGSGYKVLPTFDLGLYANKDGSLGILLDGKDDPEVWIPINKKFGPVSIKQIGIVYNEGDLPSFDFLVDGGLDLAGLLVQVDDLGVNIPLKHIFAPSQWSYTLKGMGISVNAGGVRISGAMFEDDSKGYIEYAGLLSMTFADCSPLPNLGLTAAGAFAKPEGYVSFFVIGVLNMDLGGIPEFYITGISGGLGWNRNLLLPEVNEVDSFALVKIMDSESDPLSALQAAIGNPPNIPAQIPPMLGSYWLNFGIRFSTYKYIETIGVLYIKLGKDFAMGVIGLSEFYLPLKSWKIVKLMLGLNLGYDSKEGLFKVDAQILSNQSYIFHESLKPQGGFALYIWDSGEFVLTVGGYHEEFPIPTKYPNPPRLGVIWKPNSKTTVDVNCYFTLCSNAVMAGAYGGVEYKSWFKAWATAGFDALVMWDPFYYSFSIKFGLGWKWKSFGSTIKASFKFSGPRLKVRVCVDPGWWCPELCVTFGGSSSVAGTISFSEFVQKHVLQGEVPENSSGEGGEGYIEDWKHQILSVTMLEGDIPPPDMDNDTPDGSVERPWKVNPLFKIAINTKFPSTRGVMLPSDQSKGEFPELDEDDNPPIYVSLINTYSDEYLDFVPMMVSDVKSTLMFWINDEDDIDQLPPDYGNLEGGFTVDFETGGFPGSIWHLADDIYKPETVQFITGAVMESHIQKVGESGSVDTKQIEESDDIELPLDKTLSEHQKHHSDECSNGAHLAFMNTQTIGYMSVLKAVLSGM